MNWWQVGHTKLWLFCIFCALSLTSSAKDIEEYKKTMSCSKERTLPCECIQNLLQALIILEKIQQHNFALQHNKHAGQLSLNQANTQVDIQNEAKKIQANLQSYSIEGNESLNEGGESNEALLGVREFPKEAKDFQKDDIIMVSYDEYKSLKQYMKSFCNGFLQLNDKEQDQLFKLEWNKRALFQSRDDVNRFCKGKY